MSIYASGEYLQRNPEWHAEHSDWKAAHVQQILASNAISPKTVCEVGCGAGEVLRLLSEAWPDCVLRGYDVAPDAIAIAQPKSHDRLSFDLGQPPADVRAELVLALDVFEHIPDYIGFLREVRQLGRFQVYNIPLDLSARTLLSGNSVMMRQRKAVGHLHYFTKDTALATLEDSGHQVIDWFYTSRAFLWGRNPVRWPMVVLRRILFRIAPDFAARLLGGFSMTVLCR